MGSQTNTASSGFTIVEILVTLIIGTLFIIAVTQLYVFQTQLAGSIVANNNADLLASNNLRTYAYGKAPNWFQCVYSGGNPQAMTLISSTSPVSGIPSPVTQTVTATAPYGCGGSSTTLGYPIRIQSTVTYGPYGKTVVHATYSTY
jgi:type II secretory pathway pseudopilin PulG